MSRQGRIVVLATAGVVLVAAVWVLVVVIRNALTPVAGAGPECVVAPATGTADTTSALADTPLLSGTSGSQSALSLDAVQLQHASTINAVGLQRQLPDRARTIALATALQESSLRNLPNGDRDSLGLFQQRPSQGWGTTTEISDPVYAAGKFYDALVEVPGWQSLPLTEAAQEVQYSAFPDAYAKWEPSAERLMTALSSVQVGTVGCRAGAVAPTADTPERPALDGTAGATPALATLVDEAAAELGGLVVTGLADDGRTAIVQVTLSGFDAAGSSAVVATWMVAHVTGSGITHISVGNRLWFDHAWSAPGPTTSPAGEVRVTVAG